MWQVFDGLEKVEPNKEQETKTFYFEPISSNMSLFISDHVDVHVIRLHLKWDFQLHGNVKWQPQNGIHQKSLTHSLTHSVAHHWAPLFLGFSFFGTKIMTWITQIQNAKGHAMWNTFSECIFGTVAKVILLRIQALPVQENIQNNSELIEEKERDTSEPGRSIKISHGNNCIHRSLVGMSQSNSIPTVGNSHLMELYAKCYKTFQKLFSIFVSVVRVSASLLSLAPLSSFCVSFSLFLAYFFLPRCRLISIKNSGVTSKNTVTWNVITHLTTCSIQRHHCSLDITHALSVLYTWRIHTLLNI